MYLLPPKTLDFLEAHFHDYCLAIDIRHDDFLASQLLVVNMKYLHNTQYRFLSFKNVKRHHITVVLNKLYET